MAGFTAVALGIGAFFAAQGFWPILPFAGLEVAALAAALWVSLRRNGYREVLKFEGARLRIEVGVLGRGSMACWDLPRGSTRAVLEDDGQGGNRLLLSSGGHRYQIGRCLTDAERQDLAARLRVLCRNDWTAAPLRTLDRARHGPR